MMKLTTPVEIQTPHFTIPPCENMLFVGSCFADRIGKRFTDENFRTTVNPYGVMYNPASILHTVERWLDSTTQAPKVAFITLGTNHVYLLRETGQIVDNCEKRPQRLFEERQLSVEECADYLLRVVDRLTEACQEVRVVVTVSPIRYAKYGFHGSALSKATLLLAAEKVCSERGERVDYFPAYEIVNDELRDYRFYQPDMIHPSEQAVDYIWQRFAELYLSSEAKAFIREWKPVREALAHRPFHPDSEDYKAFMDKTRQRIEALRAKYPDMPFQG